MTAKFDAQNEREQETEGRDHQHRQASGGNREGGKTPDQPPLMPLQQVDERSARGIAVSARRRVRCPGPPVQTGRFRTRNRGATNNASATREMRLQRRRRKTGSEQQELGDAGRFQSQRLKPTRFRSQRYFQHEK